jgi:hypothetical protein
MEKTQSRIEEWKRKLVDLSRRNRLLHFRPNRGSTLQITAPTPEEVFRRLVIQEKAWKVYLPPETGDESLGSSDEQLPLVQAHAATISPISSPQAQRPTEIVCVPQAGQALRAVLRNIYRRSRSDFEERGVRILHIVFGLLEWKENPQSETVRSPILLLPVQISRASARDPYNVGPTEEEILLNPALDVKLTNDFNIRAPELPEQFDDFDLPAYIQEFAARVRSMGWSATLDCWLGLFSFHKLVMYKDLESHREIVGKHPLVRSLCEDEEVRDLVRGPIPEPDTLDKLVAPRDSYLVLDADSSQLSCIEAVKRGANLILQGPPGTGKSQTIANIVAESIAAGRSVLFLSEKMAALEVVHKRLVEASLGHYCLELHSQKANKKKVIDELYGCLRSTDQPKNGMTELEFEKITNRRRQLNEYVCGLHQVREPLMRGVFDVLGELATLDSLPLLSTGSFRPDSLTPGLMDIADQLARRLSKVWRVVVEGPRCPWDGCTIESFSIEIRTKMLALIRSTQLALSNVVDDAGRMARVFESPPPTNFAEIRWLIRIGDLLQVCLKIEGSWVTSPNLQGLLADAHRFKEKSSVYSEMKQILALRYTDAFSQIPDTLSEELNHALATTSSFLSCQVAHEPILISHRAMLLRYVDSLGRRLEDWKQEGVQISRALELPEPQTIDNLRHLLLIEELCKRPDRPEASWFFPGRLEEVQRTLPLIRSDYEARARFRTKLLSRYDESVFSLMPTAGRFRECLHGALSSLGLVAGAEADFVANIDMIVGWATELVVLVEEWKSSASVICQTLGLPLDLRIEDFPRLVRLSELCDAHDRPAREWFNVEVFKELHHALPAIRRDYETRANARAKLLEDYDEALFGKELDRLIELVSARYSSCLKWIKPGFYRLRSDLRLCRRDRKIPTQILKDLLAARDILRLEKKIAQISGRARELLGAWYRHYETDFEGAERAIALCEEWIALIGGSSSDCLVDHACIGSTPAAELRMAARHLKETLGVWERRTSHLSSQLPLTPALPSRMTLHSCQIGEIAQWAGHVIEQAQTVAGVYVEARKSLRPDASASPKEVLADLRSLCDLADLEAKIEAAADRNRNLLGDWYRGSDTNFPRIESAIAVTRDVFAAITGRPSEKLIAAVVVGSRPSSAVSKAATLVREGLAKWEEESRNLPQILPLNRIPLTGRPVDQSQLDDLMRWAKGAVGSLASFAQLIDAIEVAFRSNEARTPADILSDLNRLAQSREFEEEIRSKYQDLTENYGWRFKGIDTDWDDISCALTWTERLRATLTQDPPPKGVIALACQSATCAPETASMKQGLDEFECARKELASFFEGVQRFGGTLGLRATEELLRGMEERIDDLRDWVDFRNLEVEFHRVGLKDLHAQLTRQCHVSSDHVPNIARRALLHSWIDWVFTIDPTLGRFRTEDHEEMVREFRDLDQKHRRSGAYHVGAKAEKFKEERLASPREQPPVPGFLKTAEEKHRDRTRHNHAQNGMADEIRVLTYEAHKKKRHLPIRALLSRMPKLLTVLKPCLLMSPLSVSQFLDPEKIGFDLTIFDEASQILPEDAIGAIYRGRQLVACGDKHQLPPTTFFEQGLSDDFEAENIDESFDVFESILEECAAKAQLPTLSLRWHYRSRDESLIAFSNHRFYRNELITFPAAERENAGLGIRFVPVEDGVYDRGGKRDNPREAEVVVGQVVQHLLAQPRRSLGVVAFSVAQMHAIEDQIEVLLRKRPELEKFFAADRLEGFFVKNLENVQGDERDVMIFSIGYGRDRHGEIKMNFGPLNISGGERRLNVAVTRAREKIVIVSSIRSADFDLKRIHAPGVLALYHYLDYAERGPEALVLSQGRKGGDYESPLEQDVASAIRTLGYDVVPQVGCSGYRIDLGVIDPGKPGRFILGVECDGASYHSAHTARDRDRLRQQVLQDLGWRIHRIWSPDWVTRRTTEIRRLQEAIDAARSSIQEHVAPKTPPDGTEDEAKHNTPNLHASPLGDASNPHETKLAHETSEVAKRLDAPGGSPRTPGTPTASASKSPRIENPPNKGPAAGTQPPAASGPFARPLLNSPILWDLLFDWAMREKRLGPSQERLAGWLRMALRQKAKITEKQRQYADEIFDKATRLGFKSTGHSR